MTQNVLKNIFLDNLGEQTHYSFKYEEHGYGKRFIEWGWMTYFCRLTQKLASHWFPGQKASGMLDYSWKSALWRTQVYDTRFVQHDNLSTFVFFEV